MNYKGIGILGVTRKIYGGEESSRVGKRMREREREREKSGRVKVI